MTILAAILCRAFGHKPYEHPGIAWDHDLPVRWRSSRAVMITRCKRCDVKLGERPMRRDEEPVEA